MFDGGGPIARSFMVMSFLTAGVLMGLQHVQSSAGGFRLGDRPPAPQSVEASAAQPFEAVLQPVASEAGPTAAGGGGMTAPVTPVALPATSVVRPVVPNPQPSRAIAPQVANAGHSLPFNNPYASSSTFVPAVAAMRELLLPLPEQVVQVVVDLGDRQAYVYRGPDQVAAYPVAIGMDGWETPTGRFQVIDMQVDPHWQHPITRADIPPGPDNPLGSRWIAFLPMDDGVIGFHGTYQTELLGQAVSHGCIRMHNADIEALFEKVSLGTPVIVQP